MIKPTQLITSICLLSATLTASAANMAIFNGDDGDFISGSKGAALNNLTVTQGDGRLSFTGTEGWYINFASTDKSPLKVGYYENAQREAFHDSAHPGLEVYGDGRGCNTLTGGFTVLEANYDKDGKIQSFAANYEQHCESMGPALHGVIRYHSDIPAF